MYGLYDSVILLHSLTQRKTRSQEKSLAFSEMRRIIVSHTQDKCKIAYSKLLNHCTTIISSITHAFPKRVSSLIVCPKQTNFI